MKGFCISLSAAFICHMNEQVRYYHGERTSLHQDKVTSNECLPCLNYRD